MLVPPSKKYSVSLLFPSRRRRIARVRGQNERSRRDDVRLDAVIQRGPATAERHQPFRIVGHAIRRNRRGWKIDSAIRAVRQCFGRPIVFGRAHRHAILRGAGWFNRIEIDDAIGVRIDALVARRKANHKVAMIPDEVIEFMTLDVVFAITFDIAPRVGMHARLVGRVPAC